MTDTTTAREHPLQELDRVVIRFAGDSGDGMQLTGDRFTTSSALFGNGPVHPPGLPRRDPGAGRHPGRGVGLSRSTSLTTTSSPPATTPPCWWP